MNEARDHVVKVCVCMGSSCFARGNGQNTRALKEYLARRGLAARVELSGLLCQGACSQGPNIRIEGREHHEVRPSGLVAILEHVLPPRGEGGPST